MMEKQVDKSHYKFLSYMGIPRWVSLWYQLNEVLAQSPESVLEVGPGPGAFKFVSKAFGLDIKTMDIDKDLMPDFVGSAEKMPFCDQSIDVVCAFQVLEHMPFHKSLKALTEFCRVANKAVVISVPDSKKVYASTVTMPFFGALKFGVLRPFFKRPVHHFDGEHYWEVNKKGYGISKVEEDIKKVSTGFSLRTYRVHENMYHRFFVLEKLDNSSLPD